jgi:UDP-glucose 4-epimerase
MPTSRSRLRFSNVISPDGYPGFAAFQSDPASRPWNLWGYIDARDGEQAIMRALHAGRPGFDRFIIAAADRDGTVVGVAVGRVLFFR